MVRYARCDLLLDMKRCSNACPSPCLAQVKRYLIETSWSDCGDDRSFVESIYCKWVNEMMVLRSKFLNFNVQIGHFTSRNYTYWRGRIVHRQTSIDQNVESILSSSCSISTLERLVSSQHSAVTKTSTKFGRDMDGWRLCKMCVAHENWRHSWRKQIRVCVCMYVNVCKCM